MQSDYELRVAITADNRKGIWAHSTMIRRGRSWRSAGQAPVDASAHTLLAIALTSALQDVGVKYGQQIAQRANVAKPRVLVVTDDRSFADALNGQADSLRAAKNILAELQRQAARFTIAAELATDLQPSLIRTWAQRRILAARDYRPRVFAPQAVSEF